MAFEGPLTKEELEDHVAWFSKRAWAYSLCGGYEDEGDRFKRLVQILRSIQIPEKKA